MLLCPLTLGKPYQRTIFLDDPCHGHTRNALCAPMQRCRDAEYCLAGWGGPYLWGKATAFPLRRKALARIFIFKENCACFNTTASFRTSCSRSPRQLQGEILCHIFPEITYSFYVLLEQLWYSYLNERCAAVRPKHIASKAYDALGSVFERALVTMHKMPRIWELYLNMLAAQRVITMVRHTCDRALAALPVTQHGRIWKIYLVSP